jgi:hypothetical protein
LRFKQGCQFRAISRKKQHAKAQIRAISGSVGGFFSQLLLPGLFPGIRASTG